MSEMDDLRRALVLLARALPEAESRLVEATATWTPEKALAYKAMSEEVQRLRWELERVADALERLDGGAGGS